MNILRHLRPRAQQLRRALLPTLIVAGAAITCDSPMAPRQAAIALAPVLDVAGLRQFAGLSIDQVRVSVIRPPSDTIINRRVWAFSLDSASIELQIAVEVSGTEQLDVVFELMAAGNVIFTGTQTVTVTEGQASPAPTPIVPTYSGPGANIASIQVTPRDSGAAFGATVPFGVTALDSSGNPVANFYVGWWSSSATHPINAGGTLTAGNARGTVWVRAHTPTGIKDSTRIIVAPVPTAVSVVSGSGQSGPLGATLGQQLVARVIAQDGGPVVGIPVTFAATSGGGSVNPTTALTDMNGDARTTATLGTSVGANTFTASVTGLSAATFNGSATSGAATTLVFLVQPSNTTAGQTIAPSIQVAARDGQGNTVTSFSGNITMAIASNPGSGTLTGTATQPAVSGVATFGNLSIAKSGNGYTLSANAATLTGTTSAGFNIAAGPATTLALASGGSQSANPSTLLPNPVVVLVTDANANPVPGVGIAFAVATGGGSVGTPAATTNASGQASTTWTLGSAAGAQTITATSTGLTGSPLTVGANAAATGSTTVAPQFDTLTAINAQRTLVAQARDASNNPIAGTFTWATRNAAIATVSASGVVTGLANGTTYIVATEAGGTRDSARITVEQRIASIAITPAGRNIYLTRNFTFSASAVDGLGTPIPVQPTFTWSTLAPAVATVDPSTGLVTGVGLGSAQIRATSGAIIGVANINIITPITRIAVVVDTVNAAVTDTFTLTSLGLTRTYRAIAHDTLDAVMPGVTFTWQSSNGSVAVLDNVTATTARATSAANGLTRINATAQGFTSAPGAQLTVSQVLASIELTPPTAQVAVTAQTSFIARGKDANSRYIPGGTFAYASATPAVATINATSGFATGVSLGTSDITATSGAITSNVSVLTVSASVPPVISFGRDTVSVGRGSNTQIPILLSTPHGSNLTVNLAVADTFAFWSTASVTIPAGQTAVNAQLNGRNAGTSTVTAVDGSGAGYAGASAVVKVTANMSLATGSFGINTTDIVTTQVLLSDPSPAGGTFVTFSYGTAGVAAISPDPAFIPAGQLAADIQIRAVGAGTTTITPTATGVNGASASFTAYAPTLTLSNGFIRVGQGQYNPSVYVYSPTYTNVAIPLTFTSSDTNVVTVPATATIPSGSYYAYFTTTAKNPGSATISISSPGWSTPTMTTVVTSPRLIASGGGTIFTTQPQQNISVYTADSTGNAGYRASSLVVRWASTDTTIMRVLDTLVTVAPGQYYSSAARVIPAGLVGSAYIVATASGHRSDSVLYTVQGPPLAFSFTAGRVGAGQYDANHYVYTPNNVTAPLTVTIANSDSSVAGLPTSVTIPTGSYYAYFNVRGKTPGSTAFTASAPGYAAANASYVVTTPRIVVSGGGSMNNFGPAQQFVVYTADSLGTFHYRTDSLAVTLVSSDTTKVKSDTLVYIVPGLYYAYPYRTPVDVGSAQIVATAPGHRADSVTYTVVTPKLNFSFGTYTLGRRQFRSNNEFYVYTPDNRTTPLAVTLTQRQPSVDSLSATALTIPNATYYAYFTFAGMNYGTDTIIATATGYLPDTAFVRVTSTRLVAGGLPGSLTTTNPAFVTTVYASDSVGNSHFVLDTVVVEVTSTDTTVIKPAQRFVYIPKGLNYYVQPTINVVGPGSAAIIFSDSAGVYAPDTTNAVTVTGPSLAIANGSPMLGMRQRGGVNSSYVYVPNNVTSPLVVNLLSTDTRVATVPASVTIPTGSYYAYFEVTAQDTVGTIQIQATATGYNASSMNVQVTVPRFTVSASTQLNTTSVPTTLTIYAADANGNSHPTTEDVVVTLVSTAPGVAAIDSTQVTIVSGASYTQAAKWGPAGAIGSSQLQFSDARAAQYKYNMGTLNVAVVTPQLTFSGHTMIGIGQYQDYQYIQVSDYTAAATNVTFSHGATPRTATMDNLTTNTNSGVTIPAANYYQYYRLAGTSVGTDTMVASVSSPPHIPDTVVVVVTQGRIDPISGWPSALVAGDSALVTLYARDQNQTTHYVLAATTFTLGSSANLEFRSGGAVITQAIIPAGQQYVQFYVKGLAAGGGTATITATNYTTYNNTITVNP